MRVVKPAAEREHRHPSIYLVWDGLEHDDLGERIRGVRQCQ